MAKFVAVTVLVLALAFQVASAVKYTAKANGTNSVPSITTKTSAILHFTEVNGTISGQIQLKVINNFTMAHLHIGSATQNGPIALWVWPTATKAPSNQPLIGGIKFPWTATDKDFVSTPNATTYAAFIKLLNTGKVYFNVHTTEYPGGIVRGQVTADKVKPPKKTPSGRRSLSSIFSARA